MQVGHPVNAARVTAGVLFMKLLDEVLNNSTYRDNARKLQEAITDANGLSVAADLVEESLAVTENAGKA
jgi:UDP:flavonoid glycosyltransferase YjiC (YdhE family)